MSSDAVIAQASPYPFEVEMGKTYYWCACGRSKSQPLCDGSHKDTGIEPVAYKAIETGTVYLCGCKKTSNQPLCDGSHKQL